MSESDSNGWEAEKTIHIDVQAGDAPAAQVPANTPTDVVYQPFIDGAYFDRTVLSVTARSTVSPGRPAGRNPKRGQLLLTDDLAVQIVGDLGAPGDEEAADAEADGAPDVFAKAADDGSCRAEIDTGSVWRIWVTPGSDSTFS